MSHDMLAVVPEIDDEIQFCVPPRLFVARFHLEPYPYHPKLALLIQAAELYEWYLIEYLSGLTDEAADEWLEHKLKSTNNPI